MIRMIQSMSAGHAKSYYTNSLNRSDYYLGDQELPGQFLGKMAERLGIEGPVERDVFFILCENKHPKTGRPLTPRTKKERTVGYDINFHCPKSVSIVHGLSNDDHVLNAFQKSVRDTMADIEKETTTRVRKGGVSEDRHTGELVWGEFLHQTARPVADHVPDPHLHAHCYAFNVTWDKKELKYKAAKFKDINRNMPRHQAAFHKRLADNLTELGYQVRATERSFEIVGVPKETLALFSKRTDEIGRIAKEKNITDARELAGLGAKTRAKKQKSLTMAELKESWRQQIRNLNLPKDAEYDKAVRFAREEKKPEKTTAKECIDYALSHCFERKSVVTKGDILKVAYKYALGNKAVPVETIEDHLSQDKRIIPVEQYGEIYCTTKEVLAEEKKMVELGRQSIGAKLPLFYETPQINLNEEQAWAVEYAFTNNNRVTIIKGGAGTGKTKMMTEAARLVKSANKKMMVVAPSSDAARGVLRSEGFAEAETVAKLLASEHMQRQLKDQVLWVDEAGLLGTKDMTALLELAEKYDVRLILSGDTRQHASVIRGDALRVLNSIAGVKRADVNKIYRQKSKTYRSLVDDLSKGRVFAAFEKMDAMNAIKTVDPKTVDTRLVNDYVDAIKNKRTGLVISPTHKQKDLVTDAIREKMRKAEMLGKKEIQARKLADLSMTEAQKRNWKNYEPGQYIKFNQNLSGIGRGSLWKVKNIEFNEVMIENDRGDETSLPRYAANRFSVFSESQIGVAKGDKIRITNNSFDKEKNRLDNGMTLEVTSVTATGQIALRNNNSKKTYQIDRDFGHIDHAHVATSYASQGKTVDEVFIWQPAETFGATDMKQFYVSVSRGRDNVHLYTDDRDELLMQASKMRNRRSAIELVDTKPTHDDYVRHIQRLEQPQRAKHKPTAPVTEKQQERTPDKARGYEPEL